MRRPCVVCGQPCNGTRCPRHPRPTRQQRGYDIDHDRARRKLAATLPAPCAYCGRILTSDDRWCAAHVIDGDPGAGWQHACPACNERAKVR